MSDFLAELETYRDLEGSIIKTTKINKVLKAIIKLPSIPLDEEYGFKERSIKLLAKWNEILSNDAATAPPANKEGAKAETAASTTNGNAAESKEKSEKGESTVPENEAKDEAKAERAAAAEEKKNAESEVEAAKALETSEKTNDEPDIDSAPTKEYQPPTVEAAS